MMGHNVSQEALIYDSLHEILKIWTRGYGQAKFTLDISDGVGKLQMSVNLGRSSNFQASPPDNIEDGAPYSNKKRKRKRKSPSQLARDRKRSETFRAKKVLKTGIKLPFSGHLVPAHKAGIIEAAVEKESGDLEEYTPSDTIPPPQLLLPMKKSYNKQFVIDVESTKKELFPNEPPTATEDMDTRQLKSSVMSCEAPLYHKKEAELWSKIFK